MPEEEKRIALLIDADNAPASKIDVILAEVARHGVANVRRAYGDWKSSHLKPWEATLHTYAIRPISKRLGPAYGLWIAVNIFPPVVAHLFMSLGRFISVLFPFFFWLAIRIPRERLPQVAALFAAGQAVLATWFFLWRPVV